MPAFSAMMDARDTVATETGEAVIPIWAEVEATAMGLAAAGTVFMAVLVALTLVPALLALLVRVAGDAGDSTSKGFIASQASGGPRTDQGVPRPRK